MSYGNFSTRNGQKMFTLIWIFQLWATLLPLPFMTICQITFWCYQVHSTKKLPRRHIEEDRQKTMYCKTYHGRILLSWNIAKIISNIWHWFWYVSTHFLRVWWYNRAGNSKSCLVGNSKFFHILHFWNPFIK